MHRVERRTLLILPGIVAFVTKVKRAYGLPDPECLESAEERSLDEPRED